MYFSYLFSFLFFPLSQGGLAPGGFNFDAKLLVPFFPSIDSGWKLFLTLWMSETPFLVSFSFGVIIFRRRESTDVEDLFIAHIGGMDALAHGLRNVAKIIEV